MFKADMCYHVYNHAVGNENLFRNDENFRYFLKKYTIYMSSVWDTYAYCLMPNHFHLLVRVNSLERLQSIPKFAEDVHQFVMQQFSNLLNGYAKAYNKRFDRKGALFLDYTKRIEIKNANYFSSLINYIHQNPVHHGFCDNLEAWDYSSYHAFLSAKKSKLKREEVLSWFGGTKKFEQYHLENNVYLQNDLEFI